MRYNLVFAKNIAGGSRVRMRRWFGSHGCSCDLTSCTTNKKAEIKMARILMLVVFASLLSFGKLSVLFYYRAQVLASIQFSSVRFLG